MLLAIDIGNTMTDFGLYGGNETLYFRSKSNRDVTLEEAIASSDLFFKSKNIELSKVTAAIISSVVPSLTEIYLGLCRDFLHVEPKVLGPGLKSGLKIDTDNPKEVGGDMIAVSVGAKSRFGYPCIIADLGTATKLILLDDKGSFAGCTIGAGIGLQEKSLSSSAALLPEVSLQIPRKILGKNTADCMNSALTYGNASMIRSLAEAIEKEAGYPCKRVLTGGFASYVKELLPEFEYAPNLVLDGLCDIHKRNEK